MPRLMALACSHLACLIVPLVLSIGAAHAVTVMPPPPRLVVSGQAESPVRLEAVAIDGEIHGSLAVTRVELSFHNPNKRILEGELQFPLLDGQQVVGMAMDVNGKLREAVPVEKARGQQVFEDVTRARIDPALLEVTQGNNYKLRVYPIPANGTKRVVLRISETLPVKAGMLRYRLPLSYAGKLDSLRLSLRVFGAEDKPALAAQGLGKVPFLLHGDVYEATVERHQFASGGVLDVTLPAPSRAVASAQHFDGKTYFQAEIPVPGVKAGKRPVPKRVALLWDASGSGAIRDHGREFALLDRYFKAMGSGTVVLVVYRDKSEAPQAFSIARGDWAPLRKALEAVAYDGATNPGALRPVPDAREYLLFSDGLGNFGAQPFPDLKAPVFAASAASQADFAALRHIAEKSGGRAVDLVRQEPAEAAAALLGDGPRILDIQGDGVADLVAASPFPSEGRFRVAGRVENPSAPVTVTLGMPGGKRRTLQLALPATARNDGLAALTWAQLRLAQLEAEHAFHRAEIRRLGLAFRLPTRETSLIVLDRVEDYARYEIEPPAELLADYQRLRQSAVAKRDSDRSAQIERVVALFKARQAWWDKDFPKDTPPPPAKKEEKVASEAARPSQPPMAAPSGMVKNTARERPASPSSAPAKPSALEGTGSGITIALKKWTPDAPYIARLKEAGAEDLYRVYLDERPSYTDSTAFFLDAADTFFERGLNDLGIRVLSNLAEMDLENRQILRILGYRLMQAGRADLAIPVFEKVRALSPDEPQSHRDLGLAYAADGQSQKAVEALYEVVSHPWNNRFPEVELIALAEMNAVIATAGQPVDTGPIDPRLLRNLPLDLRVILTWDADNTDIDLWVTDPNGEKAYFGHRLTYQGGSMSRDYTGGYGPEEFSLKKAKPGKYKVEANFYGQRQQVVAGATTLQLKLQTHFGTGEQQDRDVTLRLKGAREVVMVGEFEVK